MASEVISFETGPHRDGNGMPLHAGGGIPRMRPRTGITDQQIIQELKDCVDELLTTECCFWACDGPDKPRSMVTCRRCWEIRRLCMLKASLEHRIGATPAPIPPGKIPKSALPVSVRATRSYFELKAKEIAKLVDVEVRRRRARRMASHMRKLNPRFDRERFFRAFRAAA